MSTHNKTNVKHDGQCPAIFAERDERNCRCGAYKPVTDAGNPPRVKAKVRQSHDRQWPKWCVIYPDRETRWFDGENQALLAADDYNGEHYL